MLIALPLASASAETRYRPRTLFHGGYQDREIGEGFWRVTVGVNDESSVQSAVRMALYRAAELARADGYPFIQIVWHRARMGYQQRQQQSQMNITGYSAELRVRGARSAKDPIRCEMPTASSCLVHPVEHVLAQLGPTILAQR